jgi:hypothetical protein
MTSVPANLGSASHGKLKADQWRALGTTYMPISLVLLWAKVKAGDDRSERCNKILHVTVSLLSAIVIASSRVTCRAHADLFLQHMQSYLSGIAALFPDYKFQPKHHMALHLPDYLLRYGPVHAWWTFPFERVIGMLQRIPTNGRIGTYIFLSLIILSVTRPLQVNMKKLFRDRIPSRRTCAVSCTESSVPMPCSSVSQCSRSCSTPTLATHS